MIRQRTIRDRELKALLTDAIKLSDEIGNIEDRADFLKEVLGNLVVTRQLRLSGDPKSLFECRMANLFDAYGFKAKAAQTDSQWGDREAKKAPKEPKPRIADTKTNRMTLAQLAELAKEQAA